MEFDTFTIALLLHNPDGPELDAEAAAAYQDAHMAHLAELHEAGHLLAAGPVFGEELRGLSILDVDPERALELKADDPAVRAGIYSVQAFRWIVPGGAMSFSPAHFPHSMAETGL
jgi:uncharacterized protein YciI